VAKNGGPHQPATAGDEQGGLSILPVIAAGKVSPKRPSACLAQVNGPALPSLGAALHAMSDLDPACRQVDVLDLQSTQLGSAYPRVQKNKDQRGVAVG
jgi:L-lactate permease